MSPSSIIALTILLGVPVGVSYSLDSKGVPENGHRPVFPEFFVEIERQKLSGLQTSEARQTEYQPEFVAFGKALDIQPLTALRLRYFQAKAESSIIQARINQLQQSLQRVKLLVDDGITAKRKLQEQQSLWQSENSRLDAARFNIEGVINEARLNLGRELSGRILSTQSDFMDSLISGNLVILLITLQPEQSLPSDNPIFADPNGHRNSAKKAEFIAESPQSNAAFQGRSYFFQTKNPDLKPGMNVTAWIRNKENGQTGVIIPKSAVFRSMGENYVFIKTGKDRFVRREIGTGSPTQNGYFIQNTINPGELIVTIGSLMLLSEESKKPIQTDDD